MKKKIIWLVVGVLIIAIAIPLIINQAKNSMLNIYVAPSSAEVLINGKRYQNGAFSMFPGEYTVEIKADGFESKTGNVKIEANHSANVFTALKANDDYYEKNDNSDDYAILEEVAGFDEGAAEVLKSIQEAEKIYEKLPKSFKTESRYYSIEKSSDCAKRLCLKIRNFISNNYEKALEEIHKMGYDPERYEIINIDGAGNNL